MEPFLQQYIQPTDLCDFDRTPEIRSKSIDITLSAETVAERADRILRYTKNITYRYDDWDVKASETFEKGWGMCSGKTNLFVAMARSVGIPARYVVLRCRAELELFEQITSRNEELGTLLGEPYQESDHIYAEIFDDGWIACDPARDPDLEQGFRHLSIPVEIRPLHDRDDVRTMMANFDPWAVNRQQQIRMPDNRKTVLRMMNNELDTIRNIPLLRDAADDGLR